MKELLLLLVQDTTPVQEYVWSPEILWNAWAVPLIQVAATAVLFLGFGVVCYRIAKAFFKK